jgi:hypothetical protein
MPRFVKNEIQLVQPNQPVLLDGSLWANRRYLFHLEDSGIITMRGIVASPYIEYAVYQVTFNGNIALPTGATVGPIAIALARNGEPILTSRAIVTPAAVDDYFNVTSTDYIIVPRGCCFTVTVENVSAPAAPGGVAPEINVQNANLVVSRIA